MTSPFLEAPGSAWVASNALAFALRDRFPVSPGHTLVVPRRLVPTWFDATAEERAAIFELVDAVKRQLDAELQPDGYNIGINAGEAAGQTVMHLHVHVIPRFRGDVDDPRGGVRHVIPGKGNYLAGRPSPLATGGAEDPFLRHIAPNRHRSEAARPGWARSATISRISCAAGSAPPPASPERRSTSASRVHPTASGPSRRALTQPPGCRAAGSSLSPICARRPGPGALVAPDRIRAPLSLQERRPGETAFVLVRLPGESAWRYLGVARYLEDEGLWACPGIDHQAYRALGSGRGVSRTLPGGARERARALVEELLRRPGAGAMVERYGRRCRIVGRTEAGGLLTDLAWVIVGRDDVRKNRGLLDEQRVNRLRYLEGTPRAATRWIDTGWALVLEAEAAGAGAT
ncbi:HIT family protein [Sorangium sp. So ce176]